MSLKEYNRKRKFTKTPEPAGKPAKTQKGPLKFVVQLHHASHVHYDFRIEFGGDYKSWAVPKGPSLNPMDQRLAMHVEDHPLSYGTFEGIIPAGNYGAGSVMVWDSGTYVERNSEGRKDSEAAMKKGLEKGHMTFVLDGEKLKGEFALIKLKKGQPSDKAWLLIKKRDDQAQYKKDVTKQNLSVKTGRTMEQIAAQAEEAGEVWHSKRAGGKANTARIYKTEKLSEPGSSLKIKIDHLPRRVKPLLPAVAKELPKQGDWIFEEDLGGKRAIAEVDGRSVHLHSKSLLPFDKKYPEILDDLKTMDHKMVLDGEIVANGKKPSYHVFDILFIDGKDLRETPLTERKKILDHAFKDTRLTMHQAYSQKPNEVRKNGSVIAKNAHSPYHSGTSKDWLRVEIAPGKTSVGGKGKIGEEPRLTHLDKVLFPKDKYTKGDILEYYKSVSDYILPHLVDRPESLNRHPNGIDQSGFYQKDMTGYIPRWFKTQRIFSESTGKSIDYPVVQDEKGLLYVVNLGCIELNPWFSRIENLDNPDFLAVDLDPDTNSFEEVIEIAFEVKKVLDDIGATNFVKTSGATGLHICCPLKAKYNYDTVREFTENVCKVVASSHPDITSIERTPARRKNKIYLDFLQNRRGQTLAAPYSIRPREGAPVSTPLEWKELVPDLKPEDFNMRNTLQRLRRVGDLWAPLLELSVDLNKCARALEKKYG